MSRQRNLRDGLPVGPRHAHRLRGGGVAADPALVSREMERARAVRVDEVASLVADAHRLELHGFSGRGVGDLRVREVGIRDMRQGEVGILLQRQVDLHPVVVHVGRELDAGGVRLHDDGVRDVVRERAEAVFAELARG